MSQSRCLLLMERTNTHRCERAGACHWCDLMAAHSITFHSVTFPLREMIQTNALSQPGHARSEKQKKGQILLQETAFLMKMSRGFQVGSGSCGQTLSEVAYQKYNVLIGRSQKNVWIRFASTGQEWKIMILEPYVMILILYLSMILLCVCARVRASECVCIYMVKKRTVGIK